VRLTSSTIARSLTPSPTPSVISGSRPDGRRRRGLRRQTMIVVRVFLVGSVGGQRTRRPSGAPGPLRRRLSRAVVLLRRIHPTPVPSTPASAPATTAPPPHLVRSPSPRPLPLRTQPPLPPPTPAVTPSPLPHPLVPLPKTWKCPMPRPTLLRRSQFKTRSLTRVISTLPLRLAPRLNTPPSTLTWTMPSPSAHVRTSMLRRCCLVCVKCLEEAV
jgi:hypothetical protein